MRKLLAGLLLMTGPLWAAGGTQNALTVSSGTYTPIDLYNNADGASRQAIVIGDFTSSDTVRVDQVTGLRVSLSTSALTTTDGMKVVPGATNLVITSTATLPVAQQGNITINAIPTGTNNIGTVTGSTVTVLTQAGNSLSVTATNTGFNVNNSVTLNALPTGTNNIGTVTGSTVTVIPQNGSALPVSGTVSVNALPTGTNNIGTVTGSTVTANPGLAQNAYASNGTAWTQGQSVEQLILTKSGLMGVWSGPDITLNSYEVSASSASYASTTDLACLTGNSVSTTVVTGLRISCTQTTAGQVTVSVIKRSAADTGSFSTMTAVAQDSNYTVTRSSFVVFSAAPTKGALIGQVDVTAIGCMASATATPNDIYVSPSEWKQKPIVLRGPAQELCVNLGSPIDGAGTTVTGGTFNMHMTWMEINTP